MLVHDNIWQVLMCNKANFGGLTELDECMSYFVFHLGLAIF